MSACTYVRAFACIPVCMCVYLCAYVSSVCVVSACVCVVSTAPCGCVCSLHAGVHCRRRRMKFVELLTTALREFGTKVMDVKKLKTVPAQLEHEDKNVREAAKVLAVPLYRPSTQDRLGGTCVNVAIDDSVCVLM